MDIELISQTQGLLETQTFLWGPNSVEVANTLIKLSNLYMMNEEPIQAEIHLLRARQIKSEIYGEDSPQVKRLVACRAGQSQEKTGRPKVFPARAPVGERKRCKQTDEDGAFSPVEEESELCTKEVRAPAKTAPEDAVSHLLVESSGESFPLKLRTLFIGREHVNDICLQSDPLVEKSHAQIKPEADGYLIINQANPASTTLNGRAVITKAKLKAGDVVTVGRTSIRVC